MKLCVTSKGDNLDSFIDERFGRCEFFIFVDPKILDFEAVPNTYKNGYGGVGIKAGQLVSKREVKAVLTGKVGPNAFKTLQAADIKVFTGASGRVKEVIEKYNSGEFKDTENPTVSKNFGKSLRGV